MWSAAHSGHTSVICTITATCRVRATPRQRMPNVPLLAMHVVSKHFQTSRPRPIHACIWLCPCSSLCNGCDMQQCSDCNSMAPGAGADLVAVAPPLEGRSVHALDLKALPARHRSEVARYYANRPPGSEQLRDCLGKSRHGGWQAQEAHPQPCTGPALENELLVDSAATDQYGQVPLSRFPYPHAPCAQGPMASAPRAAPGACQHTQQCAC